LGQTNPQEAPPPPSDEYFPSKWIQYSSEPGRFKIKFPKTPRESSETQEQTKVYIFEHKGLLLYVATYADSLERIPDAGSYLDGVTQAWLDMNSGRNLHVVSNKPVTFAGYPARFLHVETPRDVVRVRWIVVKERIYYQFVAAPKHQNAMESANGYEKMAMAFLDSFELNK
jgi:hypothetical protein